MRCEWDKTTDLWRQMQRKIVRRQTLFPICRLGTHGICRIQWRQGFRRVLSASSLASVPSTGTMVTVEIAKQGAAYSITSVK